MDARSDQMAEAVRRRIASLPREKQQALERLLSREKANGTSSAIPRRAPECGAAPLSAAQRSLWILHQLDPASVAYIVAAAHRLRGPLDVPLLERAFRELIRRHESLRTTFSVLEGEAVQVVDGNGTGTLSVVDLRTSAPAQRAIEGDGHLQEEARRPFDLRSGPLIRAFLFHLDTEVWDLLITAHHIVADGWSMGILLRELGTLYAAAGRGYAAALPAPSLQYADYAAWQRDAGQVAAQERHLAYWRDRLAGAPKAVELPTDRPWSPLAGWRGRNAYFTASSDLVDAVRRLSRQEGATPYMAYLAAFSTLLARYSRQTEFVVGTTVATRDRSQLADVVGCFVNTVVLRVATAGDPTFRELLARVRTVAQGAYAHQELPFETLVDALRPERDPGRNPVFQVLFAYQNTPATALVLPGVAVERRDVETGVAKFDLSFELEDGEQGLRARLEYRTELFDDATIERLWEHYRTLLEGIVADPDRPLSALPMLSPVERRRVLEEWNPPPRVWPDDRSLEDMVAAQAARTPQAVALVGVTETLTYADLLGRAQGLARTLRELGAGPETLVAIWLERTPALVVSLLGVLLAGAAYLPLDPTYPPERLAFVLDDAQAPLLVTQRALVGALPAHKARVVTLEDVEAAPPGRWPPAPVAPEHPAYVIYTSGSTGRPKGVVVPRRGVTNFLYAMRDRLGPTARDTFLAVTSVAFDIALLELVLPLTVGGRVVLASRADAMDGARLAALLERHDVTYMQGTPATWRLLLAAGWRGRPELVALCGGEAMPGDLVEALGERCRALWNLYGPTETTVWSTAQQVADASRGGTPIGTPIANTRCYVLDRHGRPAPIGVPGELYLGGAGVARGYHGRPDVTAERFVPDPFGPEPGGRLYRTGDLVRWQADGTLAYQGRLDQQVKLRGFRIELGEIEAALRRMPEVREAAVALREDQTGDPRLVAYVVARGTPPPMEEFRRVLGATLPEHMVPSLVVALDSLPLTPNGKLDRKALPKPDGLRPPLGTAFLAPRTALERTIAETWCAVLRLDQVGVEDSFFDLGGKSFLLVQVHARLRDVLQRDIPVVELFRFPTIKALAEHLGEHAARTSAVERGQDRARQYREAMGQRQPALRDGSASRD